MAVNNSLVKNNDEKQVKIFDVNGYKVKLTPAIVKKYLVTGGGNVTDQEIVMYMAMCEARNLNPFIRDCYCIKYGGDNPAQLVVGIDTYRKRSAKHEKYDGTKLGIWVEHKETGEIKRMEGSIMSKKYDLIGAWCEVYRKDWKLPVIIDVNFDEYVGKKKNGEINGQWSTKPVTMITKVAESQALRKAFVEELGGTYTNDELKIEDSELNQEPILVNEQTGEVIEASKEEPKVAEQEKEYNYNPFE